METAEELFTRRDYTRQTKRENNQFCDAVIARIEKKFTDFLPGYMEWVGLGPYVGRGIMEFFLSNEEILFYLKDEGLTEGFFCVTVPLEAFDDWENWKLKNPQNK